jgi:hypothetical protein
LYIDREAAIQEVDQAIISDGVQEVVLDIVRDKVFVEVIAAEV